MNANLPRYKMRECEQEKGHIVKHLIHCFGEGMAQCQVELYSRENQNHLPALPKKTSLIDNIAGLRGTEDNELPDSPSIICIRRSCQSAGTIWAQKLPLTKYIPGY